MSYNVNPFNPDNEYSNQISTELNQANENFNVLAQAFKDNDPNTGIVKHAIISDIALYGETVVNNINKYEFSFIPFSRLNVSKDGKPPYSHNLYTSYYSLPDNKLYYFDGNKWVEVNWQDWVLNDPWYLLGKLRIYNGELQISNDGVNWHKIIPTVG
ncbi:MAG: hypothetical protein JHC31_01520, partial [Sulfurihydrogenibium sp.]|nr:hypothetical protein [Sulfurihydrogenibium sp.]